ncbi:MAG: hypothetical protein ACFE94_17610 [Candidatus Hodarchaeota archaeon]
MTDEGLRDQINKIAVEIEKIEVTAKQKEAYIKNRIEQEFGPKISEIESKLQNQKDILNQLNKNIDELTSKRKELILIVKNFEKEYSNLKRDKQKELNQKLKAIVKEKQVKSKRIDREIKILEKELKSD